MNEDEAQQIIDGAVLSDAQLTRSRNYGDAYFNLSQSGTKHYDWLKVVANALTLLGVELCEGHPKILKSVSHGTPYDYYRLDTHVSACLTLLYYKWYPGSNNKARGVKVVPKNLKLTPLSLAHWYMGDGGVTFTTGLYGGYIQDHYSLSLSPAKFTLEDIALLEAQLRELGLMKMHRNRDKRVKEGSGINLVAHSIAEINRFVDLVEPYVVPSFKYKCKRPVYKVNFRKPR